MANGSSSSNNVLPFNLIFNTIERIQADPEGFITRATEAGVIKPTYGGFTPSQQATISRASAFDKKTAGLTSKEKNVVRELDKTGGSYVIQNGAVIATGANAKQVAKDQGIPYKAGNEIRQFKDGQVQVQVGGVFVPLGTQRITADNATIPEKMALGIPLSGTEKIVAIESGITADGNLKKLVQQGKDAGLTNKQILDSLFKNQTDQGTQLLLASSSGTSALGVSKKDVGNMLNENNYLSTSFTTNYIQNELNKGNSAPNLIPVEITTGSGTTYTKVFAPNDPALRKEGITPVSPQQFARDLANQKLDIARQEVRTKKAQKLIEEKPLESAGLVIAKNLANVFELGIVGARGAIDVGAKGTVDLIATQDLSKTGKLTDARIQKIAKEVDQVFEREIADVVKLSEGKKATILGKEVASDDQVGSFVNILKENTISQVAFTAAAGVGLGAAAATANVQVLKGAGSGALAKAGKIIATKSPTTLKALQGGKQITVGTINAGGKLISKAPGATTIAKSGTKVGSVAKNIVANPNFAKVAGGTLVFTAEGAKAFNLAQRGWSFNRIAGEVGADLARLGIFAAGIGAGAKPVFQNRVKASTTSKDFIVTKKLTDIKKIDETRRLAGARGRGITLIESKVPRFFGLKSGQKIQTVGTIKTFGKADIKTLAKFPDEFLLQQIKGNNYAVVNGVKFKVDTNTMKLLSSKGFVLQEVPSKFASVGFQGSKQGRFLLAQQPAKGDFSFGLFKTQKQNKLILGLFDGQTVKGTQLQSAIITPTKLKPDKIATLTKDQFAMVKLLDKADDASALQAFSAAEKSALGFTDDIVVSSKTPSVQILGDASDDALKYLSDGVKKTAGLTDDTANIVIKKSGDTAVAQIQKAQVLGKEQIAEQIVSSGVASAKQKLITEIIQTAAQAGTTGSAEVAVITGTTTQLATRPTSIVKQGELKLITIPKQEQLLREEILVGQKDLIKVARESKVIDEVLVSELTSSLIKTSVDTAQVSLTKTAVELVELQVKEQPLITVPPFATWFTGIGLPFLPPLPGFGAVGKKKPAARKQQKGMGRGKFKPSLAALEYGITASKKPKFVTGLGVRPIIVAPKSLLTKAEAEIFFKKLKGGVKNAKKKTVKKGKRVKSKSKKTKSKRKKNSKRVRRRPQKNKKKTKASSRNSRRTVKRK